ncbi:major facilitator superfamily domain-containing protein [Obelidium mucronatum]|nr:major facilitator superfamily domain-containing protein [Obelidium mucronatum]
MVESRITQFRRSRPLAVGVVFLGSFTDIAVYSVIIPIIPFILQELNESESWIGIYLAIYGLGVIIGSLLIGWLVTKRFIGKKWGMVGSLATLFGAIALFAFSHNVWLLAVARLLQGFSASGVWVLGLALVADLYHNDDKNLGVVMGFIFTGVAIGQLMGPPIGGWLYEYGQVYPFVFCAALVAVDLLGRLLIEEPPATTVDGQKQESESNAQRLQQGSSSSTLNDDPLQQATAATTFSMKQLFTKDSLLVLALCFILSTCLTQFEPTLPLHLQDLFNYDSSQIGTIWLAFVIPNIFGGLLGGWLFDRYGIRFVCIYGIPLNIISMALLMVPGPSSGRLAWLSTMLVISGFSFGITFSPVAPAIAAVGIAVGPVAGGFLYLGVGWMWEQAVFVGALVLFYPVVFLFTRPPVSVPAVETGDSQVSLDAIISK